MSQSTLGSPFEFSVRLQHGVSGGFLPARPTEIHTLSVEGGDPTLRVESAYDMDLYGQNPRRLNTVSVPFSTEGPISLVEELYNILTSIAPVVSEDVYGYGTSITWNSPNFQWHNGGSEGCVGQEIEAPETSDQEKSQFDRAVDIVHELVDTAFTIAELDNLD